MTDLRTRGQLRILAQTLDVAPEELASLERLGAQDLRELRERISDHLFDAHAATFARVSKLAPLVPNALAAKVALKAIPPEVGGRAGGAVGLDHPDRAAGLLAELTAEYMADAAPFLDPRAIPVLAPRLPAEVLVPGANELLRRKEYTTASRFVEYATDELIRGFERGITDDVGLLHTAALTPSTDRLNDIVRVLPEQRRLRIVRASLTGSDDTLVAGISVLSRLESPWPRRSPAISCPIWTRRPSTACWPSPCARARSRNCSSPSRPSTTPCSSPSPTACPVAAATWSARSSTARKALRRNESCARWATAWTTRPASWSPNGPALPNERSGWRPIGRHPPPAKPPSRRNR